MPLHLALLLPDGVSSNSFRSKQSLNRTRLPQASDAWLSLSAVLSWALSVMKLKRGLHNKVTRGKSIGERLAEINADLRSVVSGIAQSAKRGALVLDKMLDAGATSDDLTSTRLRPLVSLFDHIDPTQLRVERAMNAQREKVKLDDLPAFINKANERPEKRRRINLIEQELDKNDQPSRLLPERVIGLSALNEKFGSKSQVVNHLLSLEQSFEPADRAGDQFIPSIAKFVQPGPERPSLL